jgi:hypothetical protein
MLAVAIALYPAAAEQQLAAVECLQRLTWAVAIAQQPAAVVHLHSVGALL